MTATSPPHFVRASSPLSESARSFLYIFSPLSVRRHSCARLKTRSIENTRLYQRSALTLFLLPDPLASSLFIERAGLELPSLLMRVCSGEEPLHVTPPPHSPPPLSPFPPFLWERRPLPLSLCEPFLSTQTKKIRYFVCCWCWGFTLNAAPSLHDRTRAGWWTFGANNTNLIAWRAPNPKKLLFTSR